MAPLARLVRTYPGTLLLTAAFLVLGTLTFTVLRDEHPAMRRYVGWDLDTLKAGRYWRQLPGTLLQGAPGFKWHQPVLILFFVGWLEYAAGGWRAITTYFVCDWISAPLATALVWGLASLGMQPAQPLLHLPSSGSSAAAIGCGAAAATLLPGRWGVVGAGTFMGIVVHSFIYQKLDASFAHLFASTVAIGLAAAFWRNAEGRRYPPGPWRSRPAPAAVADA
jgi:hypothetical protein